MGLVASGETGDFAIPGPGKNQTYVPDLNKTITRKMPKATLSASTKAARMFSTRSLSFESITTYNDDDKMLCEGKGKKQGIYQQLFHRKSLREDSIRAAFAGCSAMVTLGKIFFGRRSESGGHRLAAGVLTKRPHQNPEN